jgi:two-component system chemotaxis sensor kinase CheA
MTTIEMSDVARVFHDEGLEILAGMETAVLRLERDPSDRETIRAIFRAAHTLKGNASCLGAAGLTAFAHRVEEALQALVDARAVATPPMVSALLRAVDAMRTRVGRGADDDAEQDPGEDAILMALEGATASGGAVPDVDAAHPAASPAEDARSRSLRVDMEKLDRLVNLAGEMAVSRGRIRRMLADGTALEEIGEAFSDADRIGGELQELVLAARMVPLGPTFRQFARTVRDLATATGKLARLVVEGEDVEVDLSVLEHLRDPIAHMVRNAIDHGIETPEVRRAKGKPVQGIVTLSARHQGSNVVVGVKDDGAGFDRERLIARAIENGLPAAELERMSDEEVFSLIFEPGFSTADRVTEISGRGFGMDVVRRNVEALRGSITVSNDGGGKVSIRLPLTLAIIRVFVVGSGMGRFLIPLDHVLECLPMGAAGRRGEGLVEVRGEALPYIRLSRVLGDGNGGASREAIVIVRAGSIKAGLVVERLEGESEAVIKPLSAALGRVDGVSGSAILADGEVAFLLDLPRLLERARERTYDSETHGEFGGSR